jgi:hypothetical protein
MNKITRTLILAIAVSLALATPAAATQSVTKQLPGVPCSVTASYTFFLSARAMSYAGGVSCAGGVGQKTLNVVPQVLNASGGKRVWFTLSLAGVYQGPTPTSPLRLSASRAAVVGHVYRVLAYGRVTLPGGKTAWATACAGTCTDPAALSITPTSRFAPQLPVTVKIGASSCFVTETGPVFTFVNESWVMSYGGQVVCSPRAIRASLSISAEVAGSGSNRGRYFTITGSGLSTGVTTRAPLRLDTARSARLGHGYRIKATAIVSYKGKTFKATASSRTFAP